MLPLLLMQVSRVIYNPSYLLLYVKKALIPVKLQLHCCHYTSTIYKVISYVYMAYMAGLTPGWKKLVRLELPTCFIYTYSTGHSPLSEMNVCTVCVNTITDN